MAKCEYCGGTLWNGILLHAECYERLLRIWHPEDENPETHEEFLKADEGEIAYNESDELLVKTSDGWRGIARLLYDEDERVWLTRDGTPVNVIGWMPIPD